AARRDRAAAQAAANSGSAAPKNLYTQGVRIMFTSSKPIGAITLLAAILSTAGPVSAQISTVFDPVGDTKCNAPAFQDVVFGRMTKTASGDFELLMELRSEERRVGHERRRRSSESWCAGDDN